MGQITDYASLAAAIESWDERSHDADELIGLAEAEFRLALGPNYRRETTSSLAFASGLATLPTDFIRFIALSDTVYGNIEMVSWDALTDYNPGASAGVPAKCAILGGQIKTDSSFTGSRTLTYEGTLAALTASNTTNWLLDAAPQAYLAMCMHFAKAKYEDPSAPGYKSAALQTLNDLAIQGMAAQYGRASLRLRAAP